MPKRAERFSLPAAALARLLQPSRSRGAESRLRNLERSHFTEETGAGIQLGPNATMSLRRSARSM